MHIFRGAIELFVVSHSLSCRVFLYDCIIHDMTSVMHKIAYNLGETFIIQIAQTECSYSLVMLSRTFPQMSRLVAPSSLVIVLAFSLSFIMCTFDTFGVL